MRPSSRTIHKVLATGAVCLLFLTGCSKKQGELAGVVQYKGKPVVMGTVTVFAAGNSPHQGAIDQGKYRVTGIPPGPVRVVVVSEDPNATTTKGRGPMDRGGPRPADAEKVQRPTPQPARIDGWFPIPKKYGEPSTTPLELTLAGGKKEYDINLVD